MGNRLASPLVAAVVGGGVTAAALLGSGVVDRGTTTTVVRQSPLALSAAPAREDADGGLTASDIYKRDAPGVVLVESRSVQSEDSPFDVFPRAQDNVSIGSGFVVDERGYILTNAHVVDESTGVKVAFSDKRSVPATIVGKDLSTDLALLKVDTKGLAPKPLPLGDSDKVEVGDPTVAIGNPGGLERTLTTGVVSALKRQLTAPNGFTIDDVIQTDAPINSGNSGGPLIDATGQVIGVNSQIVTQGSGGNIGIAFAVPINTAKAILPELKRTGRVERAYLGILGRTIDESLRSFDVPASRGVLVQSVTDGSPAQQSGIRGGRERTKLRGEALTLGGDVILRIDGEDVTSMEEITRLLEGRKPGDSVEIDLLRDGQRQKVRVLLADRPVR